MQEICVVIPIQHYIFISGIQHKYHTDLAVDLPIIKSQNTGMGFRYLHVIIAVYIYDTQ
jgi:hypothetical protein